MSGDDRFPDPFPGRWSPPASGRESDQPGGSGPGGDPRWDQTRVDRPVNAAGTPPQRTQQPGAQYGGQQYGAPQYGEQRGGQYGRAPYADPAQDPFGRPSSRTASSWQDQREQDPFGTPGQDRRPGNNNPRQGPNRMIVALVLVATIVIAIGAAVFFGLARPNSSDTAVTAAPTSAAPTTQAPTTQTSTAPSTSTAKETTKESKGTAPTGFVSEPWAWTGMDFGLITGISAQGAGAVITVDRAQFLSGADAAAYYAEHPALEPLDYAVVNESTDALQFLVNEDALLYGQYLLGDGSNVRTSRITISQLLSRADDVISTEQSIPVWLFHTSGEDGPVVYLAEQFIP